VTGAVLTGAAFATRWLVVERARRRGRLTARAERLGTAVSRMIENPERVATEMTVWRKVFAAVVTALSVTAARAAVGWGLRALSDRRQTPRLSAGPRAIRVGDDRVLEEGEPRP